MQYEHLIYLHLATVAPAFILGTYLMFSRKGSPAHRSIGRYYLALMFVTGTITLFMPAQVGPSFRGHFGYIHSLSLLTLITVPMAYYAARTHKVALHRYNMLGLYFGGLLIAGAFAFSPGRFLHDWLFG